jgi:protein arginine kinase activator
MKCEKCGKNDAVIKITRLRGGSLEEFTVCQQCAAEISPYQASLAKKPNLSVDALFKSLLSQGAAKFQDLDEEFHEPGKAALACPSCGLLFDRYKQTFMLGCPDCYDAFGDRLLEDIAKLHGATQHVGERRQLAEGVLDFQARHMALTAELQESIESEDFARAARIRDELRQIEESLRKASGVTAAEEN